MQMRALLFVAILTSGITDAMEAVEKAVATALGLTGAFSLSPPICLALPQFRITEGCLECFQLWHHQYIWGGRHNVFRNRPHVMQAPVCGTYQGAALHQMATSVGPRLIKALSRSLCATCTAQLNTETR